MKQINQAIHNLLAMTWKCRNRDKWALFFSEQEDEGCPANYVFIARMACFMELWCSWCKEEVSCAGE